MAHQEIRSLEYLVGVLEEENLKAEKQEKERELGPVLNGESKMADPQYQGPRETQTPYWKENSECLQHRYFEFPGEIQRIVRVSAVGTV